MARDTAADLATILAAGNLGLRLGESLFLGPTLEDDDATVPDVACFVLQTGGEPPQSYIGGGRKTYRTVTCQVRVRSARESFREGQALALAALDVLHLVNAAGYVLIEVDEGSPNYVGTDGSDRHWWTFTVDASFIDMGA